MMPQTEDHLNRRAFLKRGTGALAALAATGVAQAHASRDAHIPLGLDAHSVRSMRWKAPRLIDYAAALDADAVLFNGPHYFARLDSAYLAELKQQADSKGVRIYTGAGSICEKSTGYSDQHGNATETLALGIRLAKVLGSPVVTCRIGKLDDRYTEGGIEKRMEEVIKVMKSLRHQAQDANVRFAFENHAGDVRSEEVLTIIRAVGPDMCGSMLDPGNALWAMEDPMRQVQVLGPHVLCTSVRDYMVWASEGGATFQWTAIGDGLMDVPEFTRHLATMSPGVPLFVETISNSARPLPFLTTDHMSGYPNLRAADIMGFLALLRRGRPLEVARPPAGMSQKEFAQHHQKAELTKSFHYLRRHCNVGLKPHLQS